MRRSPLSFLTLVIMVLAGLWVDLDLALWRQRDRVIEWDVHSYYAYLPATFIYDDIELVKSDYKFDDDYFLFWPTTVENGGHVIKTTMGVAVLYAPFFFAGDLTASAFGLPRDGWSAPYKIWLQFGGLVYYALGCWSVLLLLRKAGFSDRTVAITLLLIGSGTNLFCYATQSATASHVYSFFLVACALHLFIRWHARSSWWCSVLLGVVFGLITLVRPLNALIVVPFLLYGVSDLVSLRREVVMFLRRTPELLLMGAIAALIWMPQLLYWHHITGSYFFNPYVGEGFFLSAPRLWDGLFSFRKGWLVYTPVMSAALVGTFLLRDGLRVWRAGILVFLSIFLYFTFSWWCWWYGGSLGQRPLIDCYALLALPLAATVARLSNSGKAVRWSAVALAAGAIWLNVFQTFQFERGSLHSDGMSRELYLRQFGRMAPVPEFDSLVDYPDYERARAGGR